MADADDAFLVATRVTLPLPNHLTVRAFQQALRDFTTLVTAMEFRQPQGYLAHSATPVALEPEIDLQTLEDIYEMEVPPAVLREQEEIRERNEARLEQAFVVPTLRQDLSYRRRSVERTLQISSFSYGSDLQMLVGSAAMSTASLLLTTSFVLGRLSKRRAALASDNADVKYHKMRGAAYDLVRSEMPFLEGDENDPAMRQLVNIVARLEGIEVTKRNPIVQPIELPAAPDTPAMPQARSQQAPPPGQNRP